MLTWLKKNYALVTWYVLAATAALVVGGLIGRHEIAKKGCSTELPLHDIGFISLVGVGTVFILLCLMRVVVVAIIKDVAKRNAERIESGLKPISAATVCKEKLSKIRVRDIIGALWFLVKIIGGVVGAVIAVVCVTWLAGKIVSIIVC